MCTTNWENAITSTQQMNAKEVLVDMEIMMMKLMIIMYENQFFKNQIGH